MGDWVNNKNPVAMNPVHSRIGGKNCGQKLFYLILRPRRLDTRLGSVRLRFAGRIFPNFCRAIHPPDGRKHRARIPLTNRSLVAAQQLASRSSVLAAALGVSRTNH